MATLKIKSDLILLLRKLKNPWIWILFFRVAKIWQSGLPYLWRIWRYNFKIDVRWWAKHQLKWPCIQILWGNFSRIMQSQTPSAPQTSQKMLLNLSRPPRRAGDGSTATASVFVPNNTERRRDAVSKLALSDPASFLGFQIVAHLKWPWHGRKKTNTVQS